jgi:hypothetical protein
MKILEHVYPTVCTTLAKPPGLGDYLRGGIAMAHHARERGWGFRLDFAGHPIGRFLAEPAPAQPGPPPAEFFDERATLVYDWLDAQDATGAARVCTNLLPHDSRIDDALLASVRQGLVLSEAIHAAAARVHETVSPGRFALLHLRASDEQFSGAAAVPAPLLGHIETVVEPAWGRRVAVLSNNASLKRAVCARFGWPVIDSQAVHLGDGGAEASVRDTLVDFALITRASQVWSHSVYGWASGFSRWCALMHGVPFAAIDLTPVRPWDGLRGWVRRCLDAWTVTP